VLEAMAMEIPTLASRLGVLPDTVADGETGRLLDLDPDAVARAMVDLWREPAAWRARGKAARRRALERHAPAHAAARLRALYEELLRARAGA
jgi:glycosyltransferase involved in cell wall biosynthesis